MRLTAKCFGTISYAIILISGQMCVWSPPGGLFRIQNFSVGIQMHPAKVQSILSGQAPRNMKDNQHFLDFVNFYAEFFLNLVCQIQIVYLQPGSISKLETAFVFPVSTQLSESLLCCCVQMDALAFTLRAFFSKHQKREGTISCLMPYTFYFRWLLPAERNYIFNKGLFAIKAAFQQWQFFWRDQSTQCSTHTSQVFGVLTESKNPHIRSDGIHFYPYSVFIPDIFLAYKTDYQMHIAKSEYDLPFPFLCSIILKLSNETNIIFLLRLTYSSTGMSPL